MSIIASIVRRGVLIAVFAAATGANAKAPAGTTAEVAVGPQYDTTHVYIKDASQYDAFITAFTVTFGGKASPRITANVMPVDSNTLAQYVWSPAGTLSTFAFLAPIPYPFGQERTGWLVSDMDKALAAARASGAEVIVDKFKDPIGYDAVIQFPGGVKMQLYWHFTAPSYEPLDSVPDTRIYLSADSADVFVKDFLLFSHGKVVADDKKADAAQIGRSGETFRRIRLESNFGKVLIFVTDGRLPYPFGHEITGYEVTDLDATLAKASAIGVRVLSKRSETTDRSSVMVEFPGGYIAEVHAVKAH
jgi:hypothetical protein